MPAVDASPADLASLVAYLHTLPAPQPGKEPQAEKTIASNSAAPEPSPAPTASTPSNPSAPATAAAPATASGGAQPSAGHSLFVSQGCAACHGPSGEGTHFAPSLIGIGKKFPGNALPTAPPPHKQDARRRNADRKSQRRAVGTARGILVQPRASIRRHAHCPGQRLFKRACFQTGICTRRRKSGPSRTAGRSRSAQPSRPARAESLPAQLLRKLSWRWWIDRNRCRPTIGRHSLCSSRVGP